MSAMALHLMVKEYREGGVVFRGDTRTLMCQCIEN